MDKIKLILGASLLFLVACGGGGNTDTVGGDESPDTVGGDESPDDVFTLQPPVPPSDLIATATSTSSIELFWTDNSNNETNFIVQRSSTSGNNFATIATLGVNATSYADANGMSASTTYFYRVRATNSAGNSVFSNEAFATSSSPTNASPGGIYNGTIFLNGAQRTDPIVGVVSEAGDGYFYDTYDGGIYQMQFTVNGNNSTGTFNAYLSGSGPYTSFPNGTIQDAGTQTSTILERQSITGTYSTPTDVGSFSLTNQSANYELGSSLANLTGLYIGESSYRITPTGRPARAVNLSTSLDIRSDATFVARANCVFEGQLSIIDIQYNVYRAAVIGATCGSGGVSSGGSGLGYLTPASGNTPASFTLIASAGGNYFAGIFQK